MVCNANTLYLESTFKDKAVNELAQEAHIHIKPSDLINLTEMYQQGPMVCY